MPGFALSKKVYRWAVLLLVLTGLLVFISGCELVWEERGMISGPLGNSAPNPPPQSPAQELTNVPAGPVTYQGTANVTRTGSDCVIHATGSLDIKADKSVRLEMSGPMLDNYQTCAVESSKESWIFKGSANSGVISFSSCNNSENMHAEGEGHYTNQSAQVEAFCVENKTGDTLRIFANFTR